MSSPIVEWSELCNSDSVVALAYYNSRICASVENILRPVQCEDVGVYRDALRNVVGDGGGWHGSGCGGGDRCVRRCGREVVAFCGDACLGSGWRAPGCGSEFDRVSGADEKGGASAVRGSRGDVEANGNALGRDGCAASTSLGGGDASVGGASAGCGSGAYGDLAGGVKGQVLAGFAPRGPNYERNKRNRERRKQAKQQRLEGETAVAELQLKVKAEELRRRMCQLEASADAVEKKAAVGAQLAELKASRALRDELGKKQRYEAGLDHVTEAIRLAKEMSAAEAMVGNAKVARTMGWAATVTSSASNSVAASAPGSTGISSASSVASANELAVKRKPLTALEKKLISFGKVTESVVRSARAKVGRALSLEDVVSPQAPFKLDAEQRRVLACMVANVPLDDYYGYD